jgi:glycogen(starch) synthase
MTMARAVAASDVGGLGEAVVDGKTGRFVPPSAVEALAAAVEEVSNPALAERLRARGRQAISGVSR